MNWFSISYCTATNLSSASAGLDYKTLNTITITENDIYQININVIGRFTADEIVSVMPAINSVAQEDMDLVLDMVSGIVVIFSLTNYYTLSA